MRVGLSGKGYEGTFWVMERFYILIGVGLHECMRLSKLVQ